MLQNGRLIPTLVGVAVLSSALVLVARTNSSSNPYPDPLDRAALVQPSAEPVAAEKTIIPASYQQVNRRNLEFMVPRYLPISVRVRPTKEESFSDLKNEKWVHDFELEVKNNSDKPIYYLRFTLVPDLNTPAGERSLGLMVEYGRSELFYPDEPAIAGDVPILPKQTAVLKVSSDDVMGWDYFIDLEKWPEQKRRPPRATLMFELLNHGDGTGFTSFDEKPFSVKKRDNPRPSYKKKQGVNYSHPRKRYGPELRFTEADLSSCKVLPADPAPANFSADSAATNAFLTSVIGPEAVNPAVTTLASVTNLLVQSQQVCNCTVGCRYVELNWEQECLNCPASLHADNKLCFEQADCRMVFPNFRRCFVIENDSKFWTGCYFDSVFACPAVAPTPTPTPTSTPTPTPTPIPCPFTTQANCPPGAVPRDPCTYDTDDIPEDFQNGCPILSVPTANGLCCIQPCVTQPPAPTCPFGQPTWIAEPTCMWQCPENPNPDDDPDLCAFDPCCTDPICCGDLCCQDPCCGDPFCGQECFEDCYTVCVSSCTAYDPYDWECYFEEWDCETTCDVVCF